jgi:hypothetical protein
LRRVAVWQALAAWDKAAVSWDAAGNRCRDAVRGVRLVTAAAPQGRAWNTYLLLDELEATWEQSPGRDEKRLRQLIEQLADRLDHRNLTAAQRAMLDGAPFAHFRQSFGDWAAATVDLEVLAKAIEAQEARGGELYARRIAADARLLSLASEPAAIGVADAIDRFYRAPNVRVAISDAFLERMIPRPPALAEPVRDTIAGADVAGHSVTDTDIRVLLIPDPEHWRIGLEVSGHVASSTVTRSGPAAFHSAGHTEYIAKKLIVLAPAGLYSFPSVAGADAENMLRAIDTSFDGIPLIEGLVRSIVINQHDKTEPQALAEVESKVSLKARQRLDQELDDRSHLAAGRVRTEVWSPLDMLGLRPEEVRLQTDAERLTGEVRFAAERQLGADTPRPLALADSFVSVQLHESVLNNLVGRLDVADQELTLPELYRQVARQLGREDVQIPEDLSPTARIHFSRNDPVAVSLDGGRVRVTLSIDAVKEGRRQFYDFKVHAHYRPQVRGLSAQLVRDGIIEIEGSDLRPGERVVLQAVFVSLFSESRPLTLIPPDRTADERFAGLMITQLVLDEGWLGVCLGPGHPERAALLKRIVR